MKIRLRRPGDLASCVAVLREVHDADGYPDRWPDDPVDFVDPAGTVRAWVVEVGSRIVGQLLVTEPAAGVVNICRVFVAPSARGCGAARELLVEAVSWARDRDLNAVLEVVAGTPAVAVYERSGWRFLSAGPADWVRQSGIRPTVRRYAAPAAPDPSPGRKSVDRADQPVQDGSMTMQSLIVPSNDHPLAASHWPGSDGAPTLVLLHAGVCDRRSWQRTAELLGGVGTVIAYDRRGYGETPAGSGPYRDVDDLWAVVDQVTGGPVWLVGSSMGGLLALDAALTSPDRVSGLVLFAPAVSGEPEPEKLDPQTELLDEQFAAAAGDPERRAELQIRLWLDGPTSAAGRVTGPARELARAMNAIIARNDVPDEAGSAGLDAWSQLESVRPLTTLAWGDLDIPALIEEEWEPMLTRIPSVRHRVLTGTAHLPYLERPDLVADVIRDAVRAAG